MHIIPKIIVSTYPLPNLFVPGVQKAGTTALSSFLSQHPDICLVEGKEAHVFDDPEYQLAEDKLAFAKQKYGEKLTHYNGEKYILDATPITMLHTTFISEAARMCPSAKYIVMLRDPIDRALSHYGMTKSRGLEPFSPSIALLLEPFRMIGFHHKLPFEPFESKYRDQSYLVRGNYKKQFKALMRNVEPENVLICQQENLSLAHDEFMDNIFHFLSISNIEIRKQEIFKSDNQYCLHPFAKALIKLYFKLLS